MAGSLDKIDIELRDKIAQRIKELRESSGKSQTEFALELGIDKQTLHRLETGRGATIYSINKFCMVRGITLSEFFDSVNFKTK
ncbi:helix-turn-helix domain-containing protein [Niastella caeni]|uniref:Helix-turn-helix domain-containing protein n=1 Tax=Niastella caeni TaxID=2569763 RepID=A0A4S8I300_9BACT|nr:helix-turn-helix transcriptional regulator [Niastella caeni]THU41184.1 helix-turn-helix domain-containing protein [Niastella caeni]